MLEVTIILILQIVEGALLHDNAVFDHSHAIALFNSGQSVGNDDRSAPFHHVKQRSLHLLLGVLVECARCFVQQQNVGLPDDCPRDCNSLLLPAREFAATQTALDLVAVVQSHPSFLLSSSGVHLVDLRLKLAFTLFFDCELANHTKFSIVIFLAQAFNQVLFVKTAFHRGF